MKKGWFVLFLSLLFMRPGFSQELQFGDSLVVSLLTCEPGEELYARFGHTALRVQDEKGNDIVFNYGIFDFSTKNFYWKFVLGQTDYLLDIAYTEYFLREYEARGSTVWEQVLNLTPEEINRLINILKINYLPENRMYRYNFVYDNCATRPKNRIQESINGVLVPGNVHESSTYRDLINRFLADDPWAELGINLLFGAQADRKVKLGGSDFLPLFLMENFQRAVIVNPEVNEKRPLVKQVNVLVDKQLDREKTPWLMHPLVLFIALMIPGVGFSFLKKGKFYSDLFDTFLLCITGVAGIILFVFTFFSAHPLVQYNFNLLWLNPLNLAAAVLLWLPSARKALLFYTIFNVVSTISFIVLLGLYVQEVPIYLIPLTVLVLYRMFRRMRRLLHLLAIPTPKGIQWLH